MSDADTDDPPVPKLPRGRGLKFSGPELFRIVITLAMLVALIALTKPCANAVSTFVMGFDGSGKGSAGTAVGSGKGSGSAGSAVAPITNPEDYERLEPGMTDDQVRAAVARSKAKLGSNAGSGSATAPQTGSAGSAAAPNPQQLVPMNRAGSAGSAAR